MSVATPFSSSALGTAASPYASDTIGGPSDDVTLRLGGQTLLVAESWHVCEGIYEQPSTWSIRCGWGGTAASFLSAYPCGTPFQLLVGGVVQQTGRLDGRRAAASVGGATEITLKGRDMLARVHDSYVDAQQTFSGTSGTTYSSLVWRVLLYLGLVTGAAPDGVQLRTSNEANRQVKAGKGKTIVQTSPRVGRSTPTPSPRG